MRRRRPQLRSRRPFGWIWVAVTVGIVVNSLRLRDRLARLAVIDPELAPPATDGATVDGDRVETRFVPITARHVVIDDATVLAGSRHALAHGLEVVDLVPSRLGTEAVLDVARLVDTESYRTDPFAPGRGARQALLVHPDVAARAGLDGPIRTTDLDPVEMVALAARLKRFAPTRTDLAVTTAVEPADEPAPARLAVLRALLGPAAPAVVALPIAEYALIAAGFVVNPVWASAAALATAAQPYLATAGTALAPADRRPGPAGTRLLRLPADAVRALRSQWQSRLVVPADPRAIEQRRPVYADLLADGLDGFFEPRRADCPWCGSDRLVDRIDTPDLTQFKPGRFHLDECSACGHVFQNPRLSAAGLAFYYRDAYDGLGADATDAAFAAARASIPGRLAMVRHASDEAGTSLGRWLDVGGGHGHFCLMAAEQLPDTRFEMLDQSDAVDEAEAQGWIAAGHRGEFPELAPELAGTFDVVSMHHYLEHTTDPRAELDAARTALVPGGWLLIEVPDPESRWSRLVGPYWGSWLQPQHLNLVPADNLCAALAERGFTVVDVERSEAHQPFDLTSAVAMVAQRLAPDPIRPWLPLPRCPRRVARALVLTAFGPLLALAVVADRTFGPVLARRSGGSNTYRLLARSALAAL